MAQTKTGDGSYRLQVRLPEEWRNAVEQAAQAEGVDVSTWARNAMFAKLSKDERAKLSDVRAGRPWPSTDQPKGKS